MFLFKKSQFRLIHKQFRIQYVRSTITWIKRSRLNSRVVSSRKGGQWIRKWSKRGVFLPLLYVYYFTFYKYGEQIEEQVPF